MKKAGKAVEYDPKDIDVIHLLKNLKEPNGVYPQEMLAMRRQGYLRQVAEVSAGAGLAVGLKNAAKSGQGTAIPPAAGTVVEILLIASILAEAGAVTYFYHDKIADFFNSYSNGPKVQEIANPPVVPSSVVEFELSLTPTPVFTQSLTETETAIPMGTPSLELAGHPTNQGDGNNSNNQPKSTSNSSPGSTSGTTVNSTPEPNGNNGNHYGQTPKPERTKEPGNNNSEQNQENNTSTDSNSNTQTNNKSETKKNK